MSKGPNLARERDALRWHDETRDLVKRLKLQSETAGARLAELNERLWRLLDEVEWTEEGMRKLWTRQHAMAADLARVVDEHEKARAAVEALP